MNATIVNEKKFTSTNAPDISKSSNIGNTPVITHA